MELHSKKVALLGFGVENQALLPYLLGQGALVTICDINEELALPERVVGRLGKDYLESLTDFDIIFRSPGIPYLGRELQAARQAGATISSQTKLFMEECPAQIIGVTGTKGKGTTSTLITNILKQSQVAGEINGQVYLAGNIGLPPVSLLDKLTAHDWVVLELSSFQLQDTTISPHIAVVLAVGIDHLDHHRDEAEYISAKKNIVRYQKPNDKVIVNLDSLTSRLFIEETPAETYYFSRLKSVDQGAYIQSLSEGKFVMLRLSDQAEQTICATDEVKLIGDFNLENVTAAVTAAALAGAGTNSMKQAVTSFTGLPHRLQLVATKQGVRYFDNSYSTTPESAMAAISAFEEPVTLIVGGSSKGADFTELIEQIRNSSVAHVVCIGQEGQRLHELGEDLAIPQQLHWGAATMADIVAQAAQITQPGGVVLLSPACASFDMFKNYGDRGDQFQAAVQQLAD